MKYLEVIFKVTCHTDVWQISRDLLMDLAGGAGIESFDDEADEIKGYGQRALFDQAVLDRELADFPIPDVKIDYSIREVEDVNWNQTWEASGFSPINVDDRLLIYDAKHTAPETLSPCTGSLLIGIDAVQAFGSGTHQTTRMMLSALLHMDLAGKRVLDCGCGTGILAIAASMLGACAVAAFDIDEWSVANTLHNAAINGVDNIHVLQGDASVIPDAGGPFDIVMANINRNILLRDVPAYVRAMSPVSTLIISGFLTTDAPLLRESTTALGLKETGGQQEEDWCCMTFSRQPLGCS